MIFNFRLNKGYVNSPIPQFSHCRAHRSEPTGALSPEVACGQLGSEKQSIVVSRVKVQ